MTKKRRRFVTEEQHWRNVARRQAKEHVHRVTNTKRADLLKLNPIGAEIRYLRRELAKWRGYCRAREATIGDPHGLDCEGIGLTFGPRYHEHPPRTNLRREHERKPLCSACGKPRKR